MDINNEITNLINSRLLRDKNEVELFETSKKNIMSLKSPKLIKDLCKGFDDKTNQIEVMFGLLHAIESFDRKDYINNLNESLYVIVENARSWGIRLLKRILNHQPSRILYIENIKNLNDSNKLLIKELLIEIKNDNFKQFSVAVDEVLNNI